MKTVTRYVSLSAVLAIVMSTNLDRPCADDTPADTDVRGKMGKVYDAYADLQRYLANRDAFVAKENEQVIAGLVTELSSQFHGVGEVSKRYASEPGFEKSLAHISALLEDSRNRFAEGKKLYSYWALRSAGLYCVSCHTRFEVPVDFVRGKEPPETLSVHDRADFLLATRQFGKAREAFLEAIRSQDKGLDTIDLLRKLLLVHTRVSPNPEQAITDFTSLLDVARITLYERGEVEGWLKSLRAWKAEKKTSVPPFAKAEELVRLGAASKDPLGAPGKEVELFRATALLHKLLESDPALALGTKKKALLLLGVAYSSLPVLFIDSFAELFLEQCIREFPNSDEARRAYRLYSNTVRLGFDDNEEDRVPAEILAQLEELKGLAYGIPRFESRI